MRSIVPTRLTSTSRRIVPVGGVERTHVHRTAGVGEQDVKPATVGAANRGRGRDVILHGHVGDDGA